MTKPVSIRIPTPTASVKDTPSLMAQTIAGLHEQEEARKSATESLLRALESRSASASPTRQASPPQRLLKPFSSLVHMQEPSKLRPGRSDRVKTYQEQLRALQEQTVPPPDSHSLGEMRRVYGSKRLKAVGAGPRMSVRRNAAPPLKTYTQRLKELKPDIPVVRVVPAYVSLSLLLFIEATF